MMISSDFLLVKKRHAEKNLHQHADATETSNASESFYMSILEKILGSVPWFMVRLTTTIVGLFIMAIGFVVLAFYAV